MANNQFKFDIGSTVRQVDELNKSLEALGQVAQALFGNLGRLSDTFGTKVTSAAQAVQGATGVGPGDMLTSIGQSNAGEAIRSEMRRAQIQAAMAANSGQYVTTSSGEIKEKVTSTAGTAFRPTGFTKDTLYSRAATDSLQAAADNARNSGQQSQGAMASQVPIQATTGGLLRAGGYSIADMPRMASASSGVGGLSENITKTIESLNKSNNENNRAIAGVLDKIRVDLSETNRGFLTAVQNFTAASKLGADSQEYRDAQKDLIQAMRSLEESVEDATRANEDAQNMFGGGGGGGGPGGGGFFGKFGGPLQFASRAAGVVGAGAGIGLGVYNVMQSMELGYRRAAFGAELDTAQAQGVIGQRLYQQALGAYDMTTAENLMRYRANQLFPGTRFEYLGQAGYANSLQRAAEMVNETRGIQKLERERDLVNQGITGATGILGAAAAGGLAGSVFPGVGTAIGAGIGAIGGALGFGLPAATRAIDTYYQSPYTAYSGGAGEARRLAEQYKDQAAVLDYAEQFREAELKRRSIETATINDILMTKASMREGAQLVGQYAVGADTYQQMRINQSPWLRGIQEAANEIRTGESPERSFARNVGLRVRYAETAAGRASGGLIGGYTERNPVTGAYGAYQVIDKYWQDQSIEMFGVVPSKLSPEQQNKFFTDVLLPSHRAAANRVARKSPLAARMEPEVLTGLMQLGEGNVQKYFDTLGAVDPTGGQIAGYVKALREAPNAATGALGQRGIGDLDIDINDVAAVNMPWTRFGLSQADYIRRRNQLTNVLGAGRVATDSQTSRLLQYQFGGLGSAESMMGALGNINVISGGQDNTRRLEQVLVTAVSQGFDKSRMSQQFVQTTNELARSLNLQNVGFAARSLGAQAGLTGATIGEASERSLMLAAKGVADYGAFTAQTGGVIGALKIQTAYGSGASVGYGANILQGRSSEEINNMLNELRVSGGNTQNEVLRDLLTLHGGDTAKVESILKSQATGGAGVAFRGMFNLVGAARGTSYDKMMGDLRGATGKERTKVLGEMRAIARESAMTLGISEEGAVRGLGLELEQAGLISAKENKAQFEEALRRGQARSIDPAEIMKRKVIDNLVTQYVSDPTRKIGIQQYQEYLGAQGAPISIMSGQDAAGTAITPELIAQARKDPRLMKQIEATLGQLSPVDLAQGSLITATTTGDEQKVFVSNFSMLAIEMVRMGLIQNEKKIK